MAKESVFQRIKREMGAHWVTEIAHDKLYNMAEKILGDIAYGNIISEEDKYYLTTDPVIDILIEFCKCRITHVEYAYVCETFMRDFGAVINNGGDVFTKANENTIVKNQLCPSTENFLKGYSGWFDQATNVLYANVYNSMSSCWYFYKSAIECLNNYKYTKDITNIIKLSSLAAKYKKYINPNKFM